MKKTNENGRSMVEMLGVLAIIGVLSVGGIAGYTLAMNKYRANEIVNAVVQAAVECRTRGSISSEIYEGIQGIDGPTISCYKQSLGIVSFTISDPNIAKAVVKTINVYSALEGTAPNITGVDTSTKLTSSTEDGNLTSLVYYQPVS